MIKLVIFDLDGTLINSIYDLGDAVNNVLSRNGYKTHGLEKFYYFVGNGTTKLVERAVPQGTSEDEIDKLHKQFLTEYDEHCLDKTDCYDGVKEMLSQLEQRGVLYAVASNKTDAFTKKIVKKLMGDKNFFDVVGALEGVPKKPSPEIVFNIMNKAKLSPQEVIYVGDSDVDVVTGHNAGLEVCGCEWGFRGKEELLNAGCDYLLSKPDDLIEIINSKERV